MDLVKNAASICLLGSIGHFLVYIGNGTIGDVVILLLYIYDIIIMLFWMQPVQGHRSRQEYMSAIFGNLSSLGFNAFLFGTRLGWSGFLVPLALTSVAVYWDMTKILPREWPPRRRTALQARKHFRLYFL